MSKLFYSILLRSVSFRSKPLLATFLMVLVWSPYNSFAQNQLIRFFPRLSVYAWQTMVELRKVFDTFIAFISQTIVSFNFRAERKDQFMLLIEYKFSNSKFYQVLVQGDLALSN